MRLPTPDTSVLSNLGDTGTKVDRFLRVLSRGRYSSESLFKERKKKTDYVLAQLRKMMESLRAQRESGAQKEADKIEAELNDYLKQYEEVKNIARGADSVEQFRAACDQLEKKIKLPAIESTKRAARVAGKDQQVSDDVAVQDEQGGDRFADGSDGIQEWDVLVNRLRAALTETPVGVDEIELQQFYLQQLDKNAQQMMTDMDARITDAEEGGEDGQLANESARMAEEYQNLYDAVQNRLKYLQTMLDKHPLTEKQAYHSKALAVEAAIGVLNKTLSSLNENAGVGDKGNAQKVLQQCKTFLEQRKAEMLKRQDNVAVRNLKEVLGDKKGKGDEIKSLLKAGKLQEIPLATPKIGEDGIMKLVLDDAFEKAGLNTKQVEHRLHEAQIQALNNQDWKPIEREVVLQQGGKEIKLESHITPASSLGNIFEGRSGGVCSHDTKAHKTTVNLAATELKDKDGKVLFSALRHGINSAYGITPDELEHMDIDELGKMLKALLPREQWVPFPNYDAYTGPDQEYDPTVQKLRKDKKYRESVAEIMRQQANLNRGKDIIVAVVVKDPAKLKQAQRGEPVAISINSISLVTPDPIRGGEGDEKKMLADQIEAWKRLKGEQEITIKDENGRLKKVKVVVKVNAFNFGVNAGAVALGPLSTSGLTSGWGTSDEYNSEALEGLAQQVAAWKGDTRRQGQQRLKEFEHRIDVRRDHLAKAEKELEALKNRRSLGREDRDRREEQLPKQIEEHKKTIAEYAKQQERQLADNQQMEDKIKLVRKLEGQIAKIWDSGSYKSQGNEPYKLVSRLAVLTHLLDGTPAFNCKSGKDRTGQLDVEAKLLAQQIAETGDIPEPDHEPDVEEKNNRLQMALNSGNHEMQQLNTGHMGFKLEGVSALDESLGGKEAVIVTQGASKYTKA